MYAVFKRRAGVGEVYLVYRANLRFENRYGLMRTDRSVMHVRIKLHVDVMVIIDGKRKENGSIFNPIPPRSFRAFALYPAICIRR
jgi:hypothetical protein